MVGRPRPGGSQLRRAACRSVSAGIRAAFVPRCAPWRAATGGQGWSAPPPPSACGLGFGPELAGEEVADWFLYRWPDRWPDVRASDALEVCATEYACHGLELDVVGLIWGSDFLPHPHGGWCARSFAGTRWHRVGREFAFYRNTYRVQLTRAWYETVILVPRGDANDPTRTPPPRSIRSRGACLRPGRPRSIATSPLRPSQRCRCASGATSRPATSERDSGSRCARLRARSNDPRSGRRAQHRPVPLAAGRADRDRCGGCGRVVRSSGSG